MVMKKFDVSTKAGRVARAKHAMRIRLGKAKAESMRKAEQSIPLDAIPDRAATRGRYKSHKKGTARSADVALELARLLVRVLEG